MQNNSPGWIHTSEFSFSLDWKWMDCLLLFFLSVFPWLSLTHTVVLFVYRWVLLTALLGCSTVRTPRPPPWNTAPSTECLSSRFVIWWKHCFLFLSLIIISLFSLLLALNLFLMPLKHIKLILKQSDKSGVFLWHTWKKQNFNWN